jgi:predicted unusual protein kinase regulating ubiquinone biosynthesis (AarF/ABC1/UbiB family)
MSTVKEIEAAIAQLPKDEFWKLTDRVIALREEEWDRQIEKDAKSGKLDKLFEQADHDFEAGRCKEL